MGSGASKGIAAGVEAASMDDLKGALSTLPAEEKAKVLAALTAEESKPATAKPEVDNYEMLHDGQYVLTNATQASQAPR